MRTEAYKYTMDVFIIHTSRQTGQFFFSCDHCQGIDDSTHKHKEWYKRNGFVPITYRPTKTSVVKEPSEYIRLQCDPDNMTWVRNPEPEFEPVWVGDLADLMGRTVHDSGIETEKEKI